MVALLSTHFYAIFKTKLAKNQNLTLYQELCLAAVKYTFCDREFFVFESDLNSLGNCLTIFSVSQEDNCGMLRHRVKPSIRWLTFLEILLAKWSSFLY